MKTILVLTVLIAVALAGPRLDEIRAAVKACGAEYEGPNNLRTLIMKEDADKVKLGEKIFCINKKIGIQKENGDIDEEVFLRDSQAIEDENKRNKLKECMKRNGATPEEAAFNYLKCCETTLESLKH
ncbi:uncharacterized protein LOC130450175 [Diorhabda sublineata]|uniref:uncharacterized protein LOC130450175 n=1 Tax=Diorhabda sublineata TaxID=1163346 RepID=UPI0024E140F1|nr:uncharacterized protein LOC130450175 [Diorhabda sublineata]